MKSEEFFTGLGKDIETNIEAELLFMLRQRVYAAERVVCTDAKVQAPFLRRSLQKMLVEFSCGGDEKTPELIFLESEIKRIEELEKAVEAFLPNLMSPRCSYADDAANLARYFDALNLASDTRERRESRTAMAWGKIRRWVYYCAVFFGVIKQRYPPNTFPHLGGT